MNSQKKIILSGYFGFDNLGDEAILNYMVSFLKEHNIEPIVLSGNPEKTTNQFQVSSINRTDVSAIVDAIKSSDGLISGGGSLLQDVTSKKSILYYLFMMLLAKTHNKPIYFYGQGLGPISSNLMRWCTKKVLHHAHSISVRDMESKEFLQNKVKLRNKEIAVIHDPVLFYPSVPEKEYMLTETEKEFLMKRPVFLSLRPTNDDEIVITEMKKYISALQKENIPVLSFGFHPNQDNDFTKNILKDYDNCLFIERDIDLDTASYIMRKSCLVVGIRLHSLILAASQCTPFLGISYDPKIDSFVKKYNKEVVGTTANLQHEKLLEETKNIMRNDTIEQILLEEAKWNMKKTNDEYNKQLMQLIKGDNGEKTI